jgi:hypothetical protein
MIYFRSAHWEHGTRNPEPGTRNPEHGTRNPEPGTWNTDPGMPPFPPFEVYADLSIAKSGIPGTLRPLK